MKYMILSNPDPDRLCELVENAIRDGWKPQGGVCFEINRMSMDIRFSEVSGRYLQAMVRKK